MNTRREFFRSLLRSAATAAALAYAPSAMLKPRWVRPSEVTVFYKPEIRTSYRWVAECPTGNVVASGETNMATMNREIDKAIKSWQKSEVYSYRVTARELS